MLLGFDAVGRFGLLQFPPLQSAALVVSGGVFTQTRRQATFAFTQASAVAQLSTVGTLATLNIGLPANSGTLAVTGLSATFKKILLATQNSFSFDGAGNKFNIRQSVAVGDHTISGNSSSFVTGFQAHSVDYVVVVPEGNFARDFEAWFPRPFDLDDWAFRTTEGDTWSSIPSAPPSWNPRVRQADAWMPAEKQSETWNEE